MFTIEQNYRKAPFWCDTPPLVEEIYMLPGPPLAVIACTGTEVIPQRVRNHANALRALQHPQRRGGEDDGLLDILDQVSATHDISGPSAGNYIEADKFDEAGISLEYMAYDYPDYPQLYNPFDGQVWTLDLLFNSGLEASRYIWGRGRDEFLTKGSVIDE